MNQKEKEFFFNRIKSRVDFKWLSFICDDDFYIAGNSFNGDRANDIDIFPTTKDQFTSLKFNKDFDTVLSVTRNIVTVNHNGTVYQFCNYYHDSIEGLVNSFDFAHIQIGMRIWVTENFIEDPVGMNDFDLYFSDNFVQSKITGDTFFVNSNYPLSSLIRMFKYHKRGDFTGKSYVFTAIKIMMEIVNRGFIDYNGFKDQLDAVDLGLLPEDLKQFGSYSKELIKSDKKDWEDE